MEKKVLMAVDDSIYSNQSLRYATHILSGSKDVTFTLFHVIRVGQRRSVNRNSAGISQATTSG